MGADGDKGAGRQDDSRGAQPGEAAVAAASTAGEAGMRVSLLMVLPPIQSRSPRAPRSRVGAAGLRCWRQMCQATPAETTMSAQTETTRTISNQRMGRRNASPIELARPTESAAPHVSDRRNLAIHSLQTSVFGWWFKASTIDKPLLPRIPDGYRRTMCPASRIACHSRPDRDGCARFSPLNIHAR